MKKIKTLSILLICMITGCQFLSAQNTWASWAHSIPAKGYEGSRFRITAAIRTELDDDSAAARIWTRVDKANGNGFFENMWNNPVRSNSWQNISIEGKIDSTAVNIIVGSLLEMNGKFYFDNLNVEVEKKKGKWESIFKEDFEKDLSNWNAGVQKGESGKNNLYTATIVKDAKTNSNVWLIEGKNVPNYGFNKKAGKFADVNGIKLYYEIYGEGKPLVVLHGNGGSISSASTHYPDLIKQYKVIAIDSRAQGRSGDTDKPLTYDQMASDVNALLEQLNIDSAYIWGQSDGAILCLLLAKDYPKKVKRVVAYAPNIQADSNAVFSWALESLKRTISRSKSKVEIKLNQMMLDYPNIPYSELESIQAPCLIMGGDRDVIRPEHLLKMFQHIPNSQLCILPGSTHGGAWEKKEMFLQIMNDFFNKPFTMPDTKEWFTE
jgi:pimeloyl-ACP methyl ester carboxylesterase